MKLSFRAGTIAAAVLVLTFNASLSAAPRLLLSASTVGPIYVAPGSNGVVQTVQASNAGTGVLNPSAITSASWLAASIGTQFSCSAPSGICWPVNVALNTSALAPGTYTEYVTVQDPNAVDSPQQIGECDCGECSKQHYALMPRRTEARHPLPSIRTAGF